MKKLLMFVVFVLSFFIYLSNDVSISFADTYVVSLPDFPDDVPTGYENYYIKKLSDYEYALYYIDTTTVYISGDNYYFSGKWWKWTYRVTEDISNHVWANKIGWYNGASDNTLIMPVGGSLDDCNIVYSNFDIMYNDTLLRSKLEMNTEPIEASDEVTLSGISGFFSNLLENLSQFFSSLGDKISNLGNIILSIPDLIIQGLQSVLEFLFVPSENLFTYAQELFEEKFGIFYQVKDFLVDLTKINVTDNLPVFEVNYKGFKGSIVDFSFYSQYRTFIHTLIIAFSYFFFGKWLLNNVPTILGGIYSSTN